MIKQEVYGVVDGMTLTRTYSDDGMMIEQDDTGEFYIDAIDPDFKSRTYTETDIPVSTWTGAETQTDEPPEEGGEDLEELGVPEENIEDEGGTGSFIPLKPNKKY